jgi:hypothetical protein
MHTLTTCHDNRSEPSEATLVPSDCPDAFGVNIVSLTGKAQVHGLLSVRGRPQHATLLRCRAQACSIVAVSALHLRGACKLPTKCKQASHQPLCKVSLRLVSSEGAAIDKRVSVKQHLLTADKGIGVSLAELDLQVGSHNAWTIVNI